MQRGLLGGLLHERVNLGLKSGVNRKVARRARAECAPGKHSPNADGQLRNDQAFCTELQGELKTALFGMCTNNPTVRGKPHHAHTKAGLIFKRVFCNYL